MIDISRLAVSLMIDRLESDIRNYKPPAGNLYDKDVFESVFGEE